MSRPSWLDPDIPQAQDPQTIERLQQIERTLATVSKQVCEDTTDQPTCMWHPCHGLISTEE